MTHLKSSLLFIPLLILILSLISCSGASKDQKEKEFQEEVMAIHDEVMPKMGRLEELSKKLDSARKSIQKKGNASDQKIAKIDSQIQALNEAHKSMMEWMRNYEEPSDTMEHSEVMAYLEREKKKIRDVKDKINTSIQQAEETLADR